MCIDQEPYASYAICKETAPDVSVGRDDGLWVVKEATGHFGDKTILDGQKDGGGHGPDGHQSMAGVHSIRADGQHQRSHTRIPGRVQHNRTQSRGYGRIAAGELVHRLPASTLVLRRKRRVPDEYSGRLDCEGIWSRTTGTDVSPLREILR